MNVSFARQGRERQRRGTVVHLVTTDTPISKQAYVFMCVFQGLRIPSVRVLSRKPQTICFEPLINYDPERFAPATTNAITERYRRLMNCECESIVDPTTREVNDRIVGTLQRPLTERLIIHYFGQGSLPPAERGSLFFFDAGHKRYRPLALSSVIGTSQAPVCLIVDVSSAGTLGRAIEAAVEDKRDIVAFMACSKNELLPSAPSLPMDILSCSILFAVESAMWFHRCRLPFSGTFESLSGEQTRGLGSFLEAVINGVAISRVQPSVYDRLFFEDPALGTISRGFLLATRILGFHNVHPQSVPELPRIDDSEVWSYWDIALDSVLSRGSSALPLLPDVYDHLVRSFEHVPSPWAVPLFIYFLQFREYTEQTIEILYNYIDTSIDMVVSSANKVLLAALLDLQRQSVSNFLIMAKLIVTHRHPQHVLNELCAMSGMLLGDSLRAGVLAMCCCLSVELPQSPSQLLSHCVRHAQTAAPYSAIMFGLIAQKSSTFQRDSRYIEAFSPLMESPHADTRAACVFAIGYTRELRAIELLVDALNDDSDLVVSEALTALCLSLRFEAARSLSDDLVNTMRDRLRKAEASSGDLVRQTYEKVRDSFSSYVGPSGAPSGPSSPREGIRVLPTSRMPTLLRQAVRSARLRDRYETKMFTGMHVPESR